MDETDHLVDLCQQFDVRFSIVQDRFDSERYQVPQLKCFLSHVHAYIIRDCVSSCMCRSGLQKI